MASQRLKLGTFLGIDLFVHWSFLLLVAYVVYASRRMGGDLAMVGFSVAQLLAVFACVTLHEYGHAMAARGFGIGTVDITLLPIGGVARLRKIPRIPIQELVIAVAGPAVNVVIAAAVFGLFFLLGGLEVVQQLLGVGGELMAPDVIESAEGPAASDFQGGNAAGDADALMQPSWAAFAMSLLVINLLLVVFNMIPAFPMDGGRVLRSILAMGLPYGIATRWAQRIGVFWAILIAAYAVSADPPRWPMLLIAGFIVYAGYAEARQVDWTDALEGLRVEDVMDRSPVVVPMETPVEELERWWTTQSVPAVAVTGLGGVLVGTIRLVDLARGYDDGGRAPSRMGRRNRRAANQVGDNGLKRTWPLTAGEIAVHDSPVLESNEPLISLVRGGREKHRQWPVIDSDAKLIGMIDLETLLAQAAVARRIGARDSSPQSQAPVPPAYGSAVESQTDWH